MSLPRQLHEQLLSAYLDDALSGDERARVEQMLAQDATVRGELEQMQRLREQTRRALAVPPPGVAARRLDDRFAERVMQAALAEARRANLPATHPLQRAAAQAAASQPAAENHSDRQRSAWTRHPAAAPLLALAAALLLAVTLVRLADQNAVDGPLVAERDGSESVVPESAPTESLASVPPDAAPVAQNAERAPGSSDRQPMVAADAVAPERTAPEDPRPTTPASRPDDRPPVESIASNGIGETAGARSAATGDASDSVAPRRSVGDAQAALQATAEATMPLNVVMVLQVEQTELGRSQDVVGQALREAGIRTGARRMVDDQIVGYLRQADMVAPSDDQQGSSMSILYIEAPGRQLDRFIVSLFRSPDQVAGIGLNLGMDPPLVAAADRLSQVDPSQVQHAADTATAWQLVSGQDQDGFILPADGRPFTPLDRQMAQAGLLSGTLGGGGLSPESGPDITGRLLLVIR